MATIDELFQTRKNSSYNINQHLETLKSYGADCDSITEFGTHIGYSTTAFIASRCPKIRCYDIAHKLDWTTKLREMAEEVGVDIEFIGGDTGQQRIEPVDLLFIDSLHTGAHLRKELFNCGDQAKRYIILHDTEICGWNDMPSSKNHPQGLKSALIDFLLANPHWFIREHYKNNCGLTVLERY